MVKIGDKITITNEDYEDYEEKYDNRVFIVSDICYGQIGGCSNLKCSHRGYDETLSPQALISADDLNISIYEYEFEIIDKDHYTPKCEYCGIMGVADFMVAINVFNYPPEANQYDVIYLHRNCKIPEKYTYVDWDGNITKKIISGDEVLVEKRKIPKRKSKASTEEVSLTTGVYLIKKDLSELEISKIKIKDKKRLQFLKQFKKQIQKTENIDTLSVKTLELHMDWAKKEMEEEFSDNNKEFGFLLEEMQKIVQKQYIKLGGKDWYNWEKSLSELLEEKIDQQYPELLAHINIPSIHCFLTESIKLVNTISNSDLEGLLEVINEKLEQTGNILHLGNKSIYLTRKGKAGRYSIMGGKKNELHYYLSGMRDALYSFNASATVSEEDLKLLKEFSKNKSKINSITLEKGGVVDTKGNVYLGRDVKDIEEKGLSNIQEVKDILKQIDIDSSHKVINRKQLNARLMTLMIAIAKTKKGELNLKKNKIKAMEEINKYREKVGFNPIDLKTYKPLQFLSATKMIQSINFKKVKEIKTIELEQLGKTPLEKDVIKLMISNLETENNKIMTKDLKIWLNDLSQYGCVSGFISELVYYNDTCAFYEKHKGEINKLLYDLIEGSGFSISELFGDKWDKEDPLVLEQYNKNLLAWFGFEETASNIGIKLGLNE